SNLKYPTASLKGRPPSSCAVICTAPMSGGTRNGSRITTSSSSANRVRITRALNSVPTATNPSVASAMTPTSGTSTRPTGTSKNRTNSGNPTPSTTATKTRFAISLPQYRLVRLSGDTSSPSSAWFSSSSWKARFRASIAANVNVTHRMVGARSMVGTAVGSRPKLNTVRTSAVNTTVETIAVRVRNSSSRSFRATVHAWANSSSIGHRPPVRLRDSGGFPPAPRREVNEPAVPLERHVGSELDPLVDVVRRQHDHATCRAPPPGYLHRPRLRADQAGEHLEKRGLACPVRPEDGEGLARHEGEGHPVERDHLPSPLAEGVPQALNREHRCGRRDLPGRTA